ncbi:enoyl-CoA hydratase-related protein [Pseudonocardia kujensis]|uniref:enoyl-CoA hydratase/isomerase family protein n=1 Tax=Pseudonocardia kujensis TaxID=1128675 RepID=UPI001E44651E|nr:enoyl-CoA hydratase-related protein [Pseudonocardia kujensis]MCE0764952.1 enoyl-CoA hydratase-related protein [Pseudonocardia kujensis]
MSESAEQGLVELVSHGDVQEIALNNPAVHNAIDPQMYEALDAAFTTAQADPEVNAIVLSGRGKSFCSGFDLKQSSDLAKQPVFDQYQLLAQQRATLLKVWDSPKPVVAAVQGHCLGAGFHLMNHVDIVVASENAKFGEPEARYSLLPQPFSVWLVGARKAKELLLLGDTIDAAEAHRIGLVNRVVPEQDLRDTAFAVARRVALMPPELMGMTKRMVNATLDAQGFRTMHEWAWDQFLITKLMTTELKEKFLSIGAKDGMREAYTWMRKRFS